VAALRNLPLARHSGQGSFFRDTARFYLACGKEAGYNERPGNSLHLHDKKAVATPKKQQEAPRFSFK
jgi:hypothetical protein